MRRRTLIAAAVLALLASAGLVWALATPERPAGPPAAGARTPAPPDASAEPAEPAEPDSGPPEAEEPQARLVEVAGQVVRLDESGQRVPVHVGDAVQWDETLETEDGSATIEVSRSATVELGRDSALSVGEPSAGVTPVRLDRGRTLASATTGGVRLSFANSDAVAETEGGQMAAVTDGEGHATVAAERGAARLSASDETVVIEERHQSSVLPGRAPSAAHAIPTSLFLRVRRPPSRTRVAATTIRGEVSPGSLITVDGEPVPVDEEGHFRARVALREGQNEVQVAATDVRGRREASAHPVVVDSSASLIGADVDW